MGNLVGNIYRGRVSNVVPGIQAAFIDLNVGKNGFLTLHKQDRLTEGQMLLVQVVKDCRGTKGPGVTRNVTLPGRYIVLEPFGNRISLSRKITCKSLRTRLRTLVQKSLPEGMGVVIRTAAAKAADEKSKMICVSSLPVGRSFCAEAKWGGARSCFIGNWICPSV